MKQSFEHLPVAEVPLEASDIHGLESLRNLGNSMNGEYPEPTQGMEMVTVGSSIPFSIRRGLHQDAQTGRLIVQVHMPGVNRDELSVRVTDGELFIEANGKSRQVELIQPLNSDRHKFELKGDILEITLEI